MIPDGVRVIHLEQTVSTSKDALRLALQGEALPLWVLADRQTGGRGRAGRHWISAPGNLQASVAVRSRAPIRQAGELALIAGIALMDAVQSACRATSPLAETRNIRLKWPNDLLIGGAKAGGILVETTTAVGEPGFLAIIGFGLNICEHPGGLANDLANDLASVPANNLRRATTSLADQGWRVSRTDAFAKLVEQLDHWLTAWDDGRGFATAIAPEWRRRSGIEGEAISVTMDNAHVHGRYRGIDGRGHLLIETADGAVQTLTHGDVALADAIEGSGSE